MRFLPATLLALLVLIQYPLWLGKGGWVKVWDLDRQLEQQQQANARQAQRNAALESEVGDLKQGLQAIEERARYELGMVRPDEVYVQINPGGSVTPQAGPSAKPASSQSIAPAQRDVLSTELQTADARDAARRAEAARRAMPR